MTTAHHLIPLDAPVGHAQRLTIHVAGRGLFVVVRDNREVFRGTFERCYNYVNAARLGLTC